MIYIASGQKLKAEVAKTLEEAVPDYGLYVSPASAWEMGKLASLGRLQLTSDPLTTFYSFADKPGIQTCPLSPEILVTSSFLPDLQHRDPMDRILIASARAIDAVLVTRDREVLSYSTRGHVKTLAC